MNIVYLLLGSNLNDRPASLQGARDAISESIGIILKESAIYESEPWGFNAKNHFLNQVIKVETVFNPFQILEFIRDIEVRLGRIRNPLPGYVSRTIDIDILFFNDEIISEDKLVIPHPKIQDRMFTLIPLSELDGSLMHPGLLKSVGELMNECPDTLQVYPYLQNTIND
jgi:2-amino-4-hydroxy-6-hydroxymethyldihydropteridine diphosphokinase